MQYFDEVKATDTTTDTKISLDFFLGKHPISSIFFLHYMAYQDNRPVRL